MIVYNHSMRYLVCSDIHGDENAFETILSLKEELSCDAIISAGDFCPTLNMEVEAYNTDFRTVMGNCDRYHTYSLLPTPRRYLMIDFNGRKIIVTHGDSYSYDSFFPQEGDIFISGHTHVSRLEKEKGIILFNPGSPSRPRDGVRSFGIISDEKIELLAFPSARVLKVLTL